MSGYIGTKSVTLSTTSATVGGSSTVGAGLTVDNDGATVLTVDRATSDGTIIDVQKDGTSVGGIGVSASDDFYIGASTANHAGVYFGTDIVYPMRANSLSDGVTSIGHSSNRFNNLYLSGGVYLGGTGAANKLDDYEEGTWTPTIYGNTTAGSFSGSNVGGWYTKVGDMVTAWFDCDGTYTGAAGNLRIGGFPFTSLSGGPEAIGSFMCDGVDTTGSAQDIVLYMGPSDDAVILFQSFDNASWTVVQTVTNATVGFRGTITYKTA